MYLGIVVLSGLTFVWVHVSFGFDRRSGGFFGTLPDSTAELLRLKCVLAGIVFKMMVSALEPD